jgi:hypothetical protein
MIMNTVISSSNLRTDQDYDARGVIARIGRIGSYQIDSTISVPVFKYLTMDAGIERYPVQFVKPAQIDMAKLQEGDIVVHPGLIYKRIPWTGDLMAHHMKALKNYRPKVIIKSEIDRDAKPIDLGAVNSVPA